MQLGMIGLGRMGANMVRRLLRWEHRCTVYDRNADQVGQVVAEGAAGATSLEDLVHKLGKPRAAWVMVPAGQATESTITALAERMESGDVIIDGGNSYFKDDIRRAKSLSSKGIHYLDVGTSGGVWGRERGYCLMIGGEREAVQRLDPIFRTLAPGRGDVPPMRAAGQSSSSAPSTAAEGYLHCGPAGAGHFVKMVHNGVEYGLMQAYAEGFDIFQRAGDQDRPPEQRYDLNVADIAELWRRGSVVGSWLLDLAAMALAEDPTLANFSGVVQDSGEGRWAVQAAVEQGVSADVLAAALFARFRSHREHTFGEKLLSAMRHKFGGHVERPTGG
jgi:6-phosphogluconate dehydrogenase